MMQTHFPPEERLAILKAADSARKWYSLDDKRVCVICDRVFTGRQIDIQSDRKGRYFLACPTPACPSNISHWFLCEVSPAQYREASNGEQREFSVLSRIKNQSEKMAVFDLPD
jgi:hypothetical protein